MKAVLADGHEAANHLVCPKCGEGYLSHNVVRIYNCTSENKPTALIIVYGLKVTLNYPNKDVETENPSSRRNAVTIAFNCEQCGDVGELCISQHKGNTEIFWRHIEQPNRPPRRGHRGRLGPFARERKHHELHAGERSETV